MKLKITAVDGRIWEFEGDAEELKKLDLDFGKAPINFGPVATWRYGGVPVPAPGPSAAPLGSAEGVCILPCNPLCLRCNGGVWHGIYPPPCVCVKTQNTWTTIISDGTQTTQTTQTTQSLERPYETTGYIQPFENHHLPEE